MPSRAHAVWQFLDESGARIPSATVTVRVPNTTTPISDTIYVNDDPDASVYPNPLTADANGFASFFLTNAKRVDLYMEKAGYTAFTVPDVDVTYPANRFTFKGAYNALTAYIADDVVTYNGETWIALRNSTGVSPIEGADWSRIAAKGTGGILETTVDAKGDLIVATAPDAVTRRAVGTNGQVLTADSAEATGVKWATPTANVDRVLIAGFSRSVVAGAVAVQLTQDVAGSPVVIPVVVPRAGSVTGLTANLTTARTAGTLTVEAYVNGVATGFTVVIDATNTQYISGTQAAALDAIAAGGRIDLRYTTSADFAGASSLIAAVEITNS